ncbi:MAG: hypothetical protein OES84_00040 [Kiritimatiellaceae bacterium]|nr:hypothetical protein [Kiritimatiellaceae bacterium]
MADFPVFSLSQSLNQATQAATGKAAIQNVVAERKKGRKAAELRQRVAEGDSDALGELMALDPKEAKNMMDALNTMDTTQREQLQAQNEAIAKSVLWTMDAPTEQERSARWDQSVDHLVNNQGFADAAKFKGQYSQDAAQQMLMQAMTMDQLLSSRQGSFGATKPGLDAEGNPVFFATDKQGQSRIVQGVTPTPKDISGTGAGRMKSSDSNAIANAIASELNVPYTQLPDGSIKYQFATDKQAKEVTETAAKAERIFRENPNIGHREAVIRARSGNVKEDGKPKKNDPGSIRDFLGKVSG